MNMTGRIYRDKNGRWVIGYYVGKQASDWRSFDFTTQTQAVEKAKEIGITKYFVGYSDVQRDVK